jgi:hypothetical protein
MTVRGEGGNPSQSWSDNSRPVDGLHLILALKCTASESRPAARPRANHAERSILWWFAPRLTALGLDEQRRLPVQAEGREASGAVERMPSLF